PPEQQEEVPLDYRGERVGELIVGVRRGQSRLDRDDRAALEMLAAPIAVAVHAGALTAAVQRSREQIVAAREEERRRLRRDLHDGLGSALTGISFQADAVGNMLESDPARAGALLAALRAAAGDAIDDVRRLVYALRPPALDELGLVGALLRHAEQLGDGAPGVTVHAQPCLPALPAAVEVAAYRVGVEALTNAVRHSGARRVDLRLAVEDGTGLLLTVCDDGRRSAVWTAGVGLASMRERAAELGGSVQAGPGDAGGRVALRLPL
ncbi:MAG: histidine kinase, partial [Pseudonocardia sp.]|nr:histidine kinase [Pseudonocardia sp.]